MVGDLVEVSEQREIPRDTDHDHWRTIKNMRHSKIAELNITVHYPTFHSLVSVMQKDYFLHSINVSAFRATSNINGNTYHPGSL